MLRIQHISTAAEELSPSHKEQTFSMGLHAGYRKADSNTSNRGGGGRGNKQAEKQTYKQTHKQTKPYVCGWKLEWSGWLQIQQTGRGGGGGGMKVLFE